MTDICQAMEASMECNNIGVALLRAGRLREALDTFKGAAHLMYPVSQCLEQHPRCHHHQQQPAPKQALSPSRQRLSNETTVLRAKSYISQVQVEEQQLMQTIDDDENLSDNAYLLTIPILLNCSFASAPPMSCTVESAVIVYNMALTYLLYGSRACQLKAISLFDMSFSLAYSVQADARSPRIAMASLNNIGVIYYSLGEYELSRGYLDTLRTYIMSLSTTTDEKPEILKEKHQLLLNTMMLTQPMIAGAA
jgi:tetratricopeptide (TPR) repeat protein